MELTDFLTESFVSTFTGTLISIELIVFVTKELPIIKKIPTRIYTFILAIAHLIIVKASAATLQLDVQNGYILVLNAMVITVILCGGYDTIMANINSIIDKNKLVSNVVKSNAGNNDTVALNQTNTEVKTGNSIAEATEEAKKPSDTVDSKDENCKE